MASSVDARRDTTVTFLPHRLNRQPVIVLGLTADELWITVGVSAACGLALGIALAALTRSIAMAPTLIVVSIAAGVFIGGGVLRRHKRGRPDTWLYRQIQWWGCQRLPGLSRYLGARDLITRSGYWTTRRATRP
jgi:conjugative transfer region protein (TIGR03750 family)